MRMQLGGAIAAPSKLAEPDITSARAKETALPDGPPNRHSHATSTLRAHRPRTARSRPAVSRCECRCTRDQRLRHCGVATPCASERQVFGWQASTLGLVRHADGRAILSDCGLMQSECLLRRHCDKPVSCRQLYFDAYGRILAICAASSGDDLSATMVRSGYALADGRDQWYLAEEAAAHAGKGIWSFISNAVEWRAQRQIDDE